MAELQKAIARLMQSKGKPLVEAEEPPFPLHPPRDETTDRSRETALREAFTRLLLDSADAQPILTEPDGGALFAASAFRFFAARPWNSVAVRVFEPTTERDGWSAAETVIESAMEDRPFIVDTVRESIEEVGGRIKLLLHPLLGVKRDLNGNITAIEAPESLTARESFLHARAVGIDSPARLQETLQHRLEQVVAVARDLPAMRRRLGELVRELREERLPTPWSEEADEVAEFLQWLDDTRFVLLGYREYELRGHGTERELGVRRGTSLGILSAEEGSRYFLPRPLEGALRHSIHEPPLMVVTKTSTASPVHRLVPMDCISVKQVNPTGIVVGERRIFGLFTSITEHEPASTLPVLRRRLGEMLEQRELVTGSHDYRTFVELFDSLPKEELLASRVDDMQEALNAILRSEGQATLRVVAHPDALRRGLFVTVLLPRARFSTELQEKVMRQVQRSLDGTLLHQHVVLDDRDQVRLHYYLTVPPPVIEKPAPEALERDLNLLLRTWDDQLRHQLALKYNPVNADRLAAKYSAIFPMSYKAETDVADAIDDIRCIEQMIEQRRAQIELRRTRRELDAGATALRLFLANERLVLSDFIPVLEHFGLRVLGEDLIELQVTPPGIVRIHTFYVEDALDPAFDLTARASALIETLHAVRSGRTESDALHSLVTRAGLDWRTVELLRAYCAHARLAGVAARATLHEALTSHPEAARRLVEVFAAKFDPSRPELPPRMRLSGPVAEADRSFLASLDAVDSVLHDRVLRALGAAVAATLRTNFYITRPEGPEAQATVIKLDASTLPYLPQPRPMFETYVHAPHMEGIHLRGGRVARGGIRLSDRPDDYRTEVLGLMKTQMVKNAVIVPVGAKGGFVLKRQHSAADVELAYRTFIGGLLSITDNFENDRAVTPRGVIAYDDADPYLVVAADKGTSAFSDLANLIASRYRFWLGDAFASGGRNGYDHKQLAITARGAWECLRQHFLEMGRDPDREPLTVIGIGDMSGDVFGNGMLRSRTIRLRAAFNHQHVFLDPDPDPERSFRERERLFHLPGSGWNDYDPACLSTGGGVYLRSAKRIVLSQQAREMLGIDVDVLTGEDLVRAVLKMDADVLWNGGIGTYVKASEETHAAVGDLANDAVRVDARELRVRVVVEGGNLGFTQRARIEFALAGGRIHTDAIDNSAGVDLSDHEVNLKIALNPLVAYRQLSVEDRNRLLNEVSGEVCAQVLGHNRRHALVLYLDHLRSRESLHQFLDLMSEIEAAGALDRQREALPVRETLRARRHTFVGLTRPELAVLLAHTKLDLQKRILNSPLCDDPALQPILDSYFPASVTGRFAPMVRSHPLRREIVSVQLANSIIDAMGTTFVHRAMQLTGRTAAEVVMAWTAMMALSGGDAVLQKLWRADSPLPLEARVQGHLLLERAIARATRWVLDELFPAGSVEALLGPLREPVGVLLSAWPDLLEGERVQVLREAVERLRAAGASEELANAIARLDGLTDALECAVLARDLFAPLAEVAEAYFRVAELIDVDWFCRQLENSAASEDRWEQRAIEGMSARIRVLRRALARNLYSCRAQPSEIEACIADFAETHRDEIGRIRSLIADLKVLSRPSLAARIVVLNELERLVRRV